MEPTGMGWQIEPLDIADSGSSSGSTDMAQCPGCALPSVANDRHP